MSRLKTDLSKFNNGWYVIGNNRISVFIWYFINIIFLKNPLNPSSAIKVFVLKLFGAQIGKGVLIRLSVNIKYPWKLNIGNHVWIGENEWIDNLAHISIGDNICIS